VKPQTPRWGDNHRLRLPSTLTTSRPPLQFRPYEASNWPVLWALLEPVFGAGETFPHDPASQAWVEQSQALMVAFDPDGAVLGTYYLRHNSLALGAYVANAGYVVAAHCRHQKIGSRLCQHLLQSARWLGFRAIQFNLVVCNNTDRTLPGAFRHRQLGYVDALVVVAWPASGVHSLY